MGKMDLEILGMVGPAIDMEARAMRARSAARIANDIVQEWIAEHQINHHHWTAELADLVSRIETEIHFDRQRQLTEQR